MKFKHLVTDVDGVLTDGGFYYNTEGKVLKKFGPHDSDGFKIEQKDPCLHHGKRRCIREDL